MMAMHTNCKLRTDQESQVFLAKQDSLDGFPLKLTFRNKIAYLFYRHLFSNIMKRIYRMLHDICTITINWRHNTHTTCEISILNFRSLIYDDCYVLWKWSFQIKCHVWTLKFLLFVDQTNKKNIPLLPSVPSVLSSKQDWTCSSFLWCQATLNF